MVTFVYRSIIILFLTCLLSFVCLSLPLVADVSKGFARPQPLALTVHQTGGLVALAVMLCIITNIMGIFTVPYLAHFVFRSAAAVQLNPFNGKFCCLPFTPAFYGSVLAKLGRSGSGDWGGALAPAV